MREWDVVDDDYGDDDDVSGVVCDLGYADHTCDGGLCVGTSRDVYLGDDRLLARQQPEEAREPGPVPPSLLSLIHI
eukprot:1555395-Rhodomonas_salina.2